ncbi:MAG: nucleoside 2-deoxyribosyltransferase [Chloroflexi bacterium]|jgi:nucleoside 2-deoxyribosyltransferase|nr:nucleoside 2-deoxyribosyltransferase [Chloroflexota bacterium]
MKIYFSCSLTGGRQDEATYGAIVDHLLAAGYDVLTAHLARPEVMQLEQVVEPREVYQRDLEWIRECDALVAEVSTPSHGVGYEIAYALQRAKPVLCCMRRGARVSKMLTGNDSPGLRLAVYEGQDEALKAVDAFLRRVVRE